MLALFIAEQIHSVVNQVAHLAVQFVFAQLRDLVHPRVALQAHLDHHVFRDYGIGEIVDVGFVVEAGRIVEGLDPKNYVQFWEDLLL